MSLLFTKILEFQFQLLLKGWSATARPTNSNRKLFTRADSRVLFSAARQCMNGKAFVSMAVQQTVKTNSSH